MGTEDTDGRIPIAPKPEVGGVSHAELKRAVESAQAEYRAQKPDRRAEATSDTNCVCHNGFWSFLNPDCKHPNHAEYIATRTQATDDALLARLERAQEALESVDYAHTGIEYQKLMAEAHDEIERLRYANENLAAAKAELVREAHYLLERALKAEAKLDG